jgi:hypothetical protein
LHTSIVAEGGIFDILIGIWPINGYSGLVSLIAKRYLGLGRHSFDFLA